MDLFSYATFPSFLLQHFQAVLSFFLTRMRLQRKPGILEPGETDQPSSFSVCNKKICSEDIKMVMERLKIQYNREEGFCVEEMEKVLEEEITMEEAQEAFRVFDKNGDGYIDAMELRRVLGCLGFKKGEEECGRMIDAADENRDGRISFHEFLKLIDTPVQTYLQS